MSYAIGLDIGIASIGYAVVALDENEMPWGIYRMGVRAFECAEQRRTGASLAEPRRQKRSMRRCWRRHQSRMGRIKNLIVKNSLITEEELLSLYNENPLTCVYKLRSDALDRRMTNKEIARILLHLAKRRGFLSNRKSETIEKEMGALLKAVNDNKTLLQTKGYRTIGEMLYKEPAFLNKDYIREDKIFDDAPRQTRNKDGNYTTTAHRNMIKTEAELIFDKQRSFGNLILTKEFEEAYLSILLSQRQFDEGPGDPSPYAGNQIEKMIGHCTLEKNPPLVRAPRASYSFEYFNLLQKINHIRLIRNGNSEKLTDNQRHIIIELAKSKAKITYHSIRKALKLPPDMLFDTVKYKGDGKYEAVEKKEKFEFLKSYHQIKNAIEKIENGYMDTVSTETIDEIGRILSTYKSDSKRKEAFSKLPLTQNVIEALLVLNGTTFCHLSLVALRKLIPFLEQGMVYTEACSAAGYSSDNLNNGEKTKYLPQHIKEEMDTITSPVCRRAIAQCIKVINAIIRDQGEESPVYINVELAREMAKSHEERKKLDAQMKENHGINDRILEKIRTNYHRLNPSGLDIIKLKLWEEQDGISPYSGKYMDCERIFENGYTEIDHIVPYSISFDDSFQNKVLCFASENREKKNRLPIQYLEEKGGTKAVEAFTVLVTNRVKSHRKKQNLLKKQITEDDRKSFKERNLQDTKTMSRFLYNYIRKYLLFAPSTTGKIERVTAVNGAVTAYLRKRWGIPKVRANGDKHHAVDALVIACANRKMIKAVSEFSKMHELRYENQSMFHSNKDRFPLPWKDFKIELDIRMSDDPVKALESTHLDFYEGFSKEKIKPIFVSRMPRRKVTGPAHEDTARSAKILDQGLVISKVPLKKLRLKNGEIEKYYNPESDSLLYEALKRRLALFGGNAEKAFKEPFYKPRSDGTNGALVSKVKIMTKSTYPVPIHQNTSVAENGRMIRIDVFYLKDTGYYAVPIYVKDTIKDNLPNHAVLGNQSRNGWKEMREENFCFSLYKNDLIYLDLRRSVSLKKVEKESSLLEEIHIDKGWFYYQEYNISNGYLSFISHDNTYVGGFGLKTIPIIIEKYQVDILGNYTKVHQEKRQYFHK